MCETICKAYANDERAAVSACAHVHTRISGEWAGDDALEDANSDSDSKSDSDSLSDAAGTAVSGPGSDSDTEDTEGLRVHDRQILACPKKMSSDVSGDMSLQ